jgi:hypothetical protein
MHVRRPSPRILTPSGSIRCPEIRQKQARFGLHSLSPIRNERSLGPNRPAGDIPMTESWRSPPGIPLGSN